MDLFAAGCCSRLQQRLILYLQLKQDLTDSRWCLLFEALCSLLLRFESALFDSLYAYPLNPLTLAAERRIAQFLPSTAPAMEDAITGNKRLFGGCDDDAG